MIDLATAPRLTDRHCAEDVQKAFGSMTRAKLIAVDPNRESWC